MTHASGTITGITASANNATALSISFSTATAGTISGTAKVALSSDGNGIDGLGTTSLGTDSVPVTAIINNYATAAVEQVSGAGTLSSAGTVYTLDLGSFANGAVN